MSARGRSSGPGSSGPRVVALGGGHGLAATLRALRRVTDELVEASRQVAAHDEVYDLEPSHSAAEPRVRRIKHPHRVHPAYAAMVRHLEDSCYTGVTRYTGSAFLRMKLGDALQRAGVKPHPAVATAKTLSPASSPGR